MATKGDLIAVEEATLKSMFTQKVINYLQTHLNTEHKKKTKQKHDCLCIWELETNILKLIFRCFLFYFPFIQQVDMSKRNDTFALGERDKILEQVKISDRKMKFGK